ncbi:MAG: hypothetical protein ACPHVC_02660 [Flavobacteriaceae bacterium]
MNHRTLITMIISCSVPYISYHFRVVYNIDLTLVSIAIIFPLVFAIRGAFKRREKALEFLSRFRSGLKTIEYYILNGSKLPDDLKEKAKALLVTISDDFMAYLSGDSHETTKIDQNMATFFDFIQDNTEMISGGTRQKIFRFMKDVHEGQENLIAVHTHRTPISLKAYCLIFIYIFPLVYTPTIINKIGFDNPAWVTYFIVALSEFILISLYNIQDQMEYPFDEDGLDDIKLNNFKIIR